MQVLTANRLADGFVVYRTADGTWSERLAGAALIDDAAAEALLAGIGAANAGGAVIGPYLIAVDAAAGEIRPLGQRELLRTRGPSVRPDLGYQAERS
jgi:hypothetical protein